MASNMLINNHKQEIMNLLQEGAGLLAKLGDSDRARHLRELRQETEKKESPAIMFYGLYNAGKSTIINALCKEEVAPTGDVPTTTEVKEVPWEGYTLIDTPGIDAHRKDTEIAENEIRRSDLILFVMDNADTFDNALIYQAIVDILKMDKPLAVVINQKNVDVDEDPNIPLANQGSMKQIIGKVSSNLEVRGAKNRMNIVESLPSFLGIFPVNALTACNAQRLSSVADQDLLYELSGIISLKNALNNSLRHSQQVYLLRTPLIDLRETLRQAVTAYQGTTIYGEKQQLAENREHLLSSRQRLRDKLLSEGLRKIESAVEQMKSAAMNGQPVEGADKRLNEELSTLLRSATDEEQAVLETEIVINAMPNYERSEAALTAQSGGDNGAWLTAGSLAAGGLAASGLAAVIPSIIVGPIVLPVELVVILATGLLDFFRSRSRKEDEKLQQAAQENQERLANYYRWLNELRDQEVKVKASYEKSINDLLRQYYDPKLAQINQALAEMDNNCAEHTRNLQALEEFQLRVSDEMASLSIAG